MGTYITHEGLPFHGPLKKIRIRSCRATDPSLPGFDEEQLLEITRDGAGKLKHLSKALATVGLHQETCSRMKMSG